MPARTCSPRLADRESLESRVGNCDLDDVGRDAPATRRHIILLTDGWSTSGQYDEIIDRMKDTFRGLYGLRDSEVTPEELVRAQALVVEKFSTDAWLNRVP